MDEIRWLEAYPDPGLIDELEAFDHHRIYVNGSPAVLITYKHRTNPDRGLLAVIHAAADRHPLAPPALRRAIEILPWKECPPPSR